MRSLRTAVLLAAAAALVGSALTVPSMASAATTGSTARTAVTPAVSTPSGYFTSMKPTRILDTRSSTPIKGGTSRALLVAGVGGVPSDGVSSVVFNLTVTQGTATHAFVTAYPWGVAKPTASTINFAKGWTGANLATVQLGTNGEIELYNSTGYVDVIVDVVGYYSDGTDVVGSATTTGPFYQTEPTRLLDTRKTKTPVPALGTLRDPILLNNGSTTATSQVTAVAVNITVATPSHSGYLTAWSGAGAAPTASILNFAAGTTVSNLAVVPVSPCTQCAAPDTGLPSIVVLNHSNAAVNIVIDIWGFYGNNTLLSGTLTYKSLAKPTRILDTRSGFGGATTFGPGSAKAISNTAGVADANTQMLVQNVTSIPSSNTVVTLWPTGLPRPTVSQQNPRAGKIVATLAYVGVGSANNFDIYNSGGDNDILVDVAGSFETYNAPHVVPAVAGAAGSSASSHWGATPAAPSVSQG